ncbi:GNAT family N-acetyltransferase [Spirulina sp. CS-785/01]|uniref:GNAT family N-acetyltransferase n=1 Tax=Spirulina sp. CS-785/01 TaxID=3021716 RepID=UPI00232F6B23|nr:GNAT family N-acetyltransferase [Spirulina sp. CS-785/01]MDB9315852.1 GNAT family N-acetyltransferase [Spirulina sp. CS-785/01]
MNPFQIRAASPSDVPAIFQLIQALADYEQLSHEVTGTVDALQEHLFGDSPYIEAIVAEVEGKVVGFALFFYNYSTFLTRPGIYLEDLFVLPEYRRQGIGTELLKAVIGLAVQRKAGRVEWSVLEWNDPAIQFYQKMGATVIPDWRTCRIIVDS